MARGVGEEVAEHLHDALLVGHHRRQVRGQVKAMSIDGAPGSGKGRLTAMVRKDLAGAPRGDVEIDVDDWNGASNEGMGDAHDRIEECRLEPCGARYRA